MSPSEALAACEASVRRNDPDRYFASLFAGARVRPLLFALYAFNHEIASASQRVREPMMGAIRLQWWREAVGDAANGHARAQPAALALSELLVGAGCPPSALESLIDARSVELAAEPFCDLAALEAHASATAGALMGIAASLLDSRADIGDLAREAGTAYGLSGILRALPFYAAHGKAFLPADGGLASGRSPDAIREAVSKMVQAARSHFARARALAAPRRILPAILPAALVPASLALVSRRRDPLRDGGDLALFRRQLIVLRAGLTGKL